MNTTMKYSLFLDSQLPQHNPHPPPKRGENKRSWLHYPWVHMQLVKPKPEANHTKVKHLIYVQKTKNGTQPEWQVDFISLWKICLSIQALQSFSTPFNPSPATPRSLYWYQCGSLWNSSNPLSFPNEDQKSNFCP